MRLGLLLALPLLFQDKPQPNEAEKLLERTREALIKAKTLQFDFTSADEDTSLKTRSSSTGSCLLAEGNRARLLIKTRWEKGAEIEYLYVSDGAKTEQRFNGTEKQLPPTKAVTHERLNACLLDLICYDRLNWPVILMWFFEAKKEEEDGEQEQSPEQWTPHLSEPQIGAEVEINGKKCREISFGRPSGMGDPDHNHVTLYIDQQTSLPVKRVFEHRNAKKEAFNTITELYSNWKLDAEIDPTKFTIPD